jgi:hypothetical protein
MEAHLEAVEAHPEAIVTHPGVIDDWIIIEPSRLTLVQLRETIEQ